MDRDYKTGKSDSVGVFSGLEIEHTPAFGKQTLFLARNDLVFDQIEALAKKDYITAGFEMEDSLWAKKHTPARAKRLSEQMKKLI